MNHPAWLDRPAYDLPPLPKYLFGVALRVVGQRRPGPAAAEAWYRDTSKTFVTPAALRGRALALGLPRGDGMCRDLRPGRPGRRPSRRGARGAPPDDQPALPDARTSGHVRRPLRGPDVNVPGRRPLDLCESLAGRIRPRLLLAAGLAGIFGGLAALSKLTGGRAMIILAAWVLLAFSLPGVISAVASRSPFPRRSRVWLRSPSSWH